MTNYCLGFLFNFGSVPNQVVLIRKKKPEWQCGSLNGVGGKIEVGETPIQAMQREFFEEAGREIDTWVPVADLHFSGGSVMWVFAAHTEDSAGIKSMTDEPIEIVNAHEPGNVLPNLRWMIPMAKLALLDPHHRPMYIAYQL